MNKEHKYSTELLIDYVDGLLDPATEVRVRSILERDEEARGILSGIHHYYEQHGKDREGLEHFLAMHAEDVPSFGEENSAAESSTKVRSIGSVAWKLVAVAAMIALIATVWTNMDQPSHGELIAMHSQEVYEFPAQTRGDDGFAQLFSLFEAGNYQGVIDLESSVQLEDTQSMERLVIALSYFHLKQWDSAEAKLRACRAEDSRFVQHATWHLALTLGQKGSWNEAKPLLKELVEAQGYKQKEAEELLGSSPD